MTPVTRCLIVVLMSSVVFGIFLPKRYGNNLYRFRSMANGYFTNEDQLKKSKGLSSIQITLHNFKSPNLNMTNLLLFEQFVDGKVYRVLVVDVHEEGSSRIKLDVKNMTNLEYYRDSPATITTEELSKLRPEDLQKNMDCVSYMTALSDGRFAGMVDSCMIVNFLFIPLPGYYFLELGCGEINATVPPGAPEVSPAAYQLKLKGPGYETGNPADFVSDCDTTTRTRA